MKTEYYRTTTTIDQLGEFEPATANQAAARPRLSFAVRGRKWRVGQKVRVKSLVQDNPNWFDAEIIELKNGVPWRIRSKSGWVDVVLGFIIEAIPLIERLVDMIKDLWKKIKGDD